MPDAPPSPPSPSLLARLTGRSVALALALGVAAALLLEPIFTTALPVLLGRTLFLSMVLLLAFAVGSQWPRERVPAWLPRWLVPVIAVALAAPLATLVVYLLWAGGNVRLLLSMPGAVQGFVWIAGSGLVIGLVLTLGALVREREALVREREAQARSQALQFELERSRLERQALDARLALMRSQIEPHFLFNTLANVQALVESGSPHAPEVLRSLIAYLRAAVPRLQDDRATLGDELALVRAYLALMQMRMPDRLAWAVQADPAALALRFPPMALLTLVENAVRHGIDPAEQGGRIDVGAVAEGPGLRVWVEDGGVGLPDAPGSGTGLSNLRERLPGFFGPGARLALHGRSPRGVRAEIVVPVVAAVSAVPAVVPAFPAPAATPAVQGLPR